MNELFQFRRELNIKKIIFAIIIILFCIVITLEIISKLFNTKKELDLEAQNPNTVFFDKNKTISVELSKQYQFSQYNSSNNYLLELRTPNNLNIFISSKDIITNRDLSAVASADLHSYIENFNGYSNLSFLKEFNIGEKIAYTYSFHYLDSSTNTPYYLQIIWLEDNNKYYIFDIEFPLKDLNNYTNIINKITNSFSILSNPIS